MKRKLLLTPVALGLLLTAPNAWASSNWGALVWNQNNWYLDSDGDGVDDSADACPSDPLKWVNPGQCGCGVADTDSDGDGTADCLDACPNDFNKVLAGQCGCGVTDTDSDGDGVADCLDNCPTTANPNQKDASGNGVGDGCDFASDSDNDGVSDGQEVLNGTDPLVSNNGSINPDGEYHGSLWQDTAVGAGGDYESVRQSLSFNGTVVGSFANVAASGGSLGETGPVRLLPNPDHTFSVANTDFNGIFSNDQAISVAGDLVGVDNTLALKINGKKGWGMGAGDLVGDYAYSEFHDTSAPQAPSIMTRRQTLYFNGAGAYDYSTLASSDGGNSSGTALYSVLNDGSLVFPGATGFVSLDGEVIVAVDTTVAQGDDAISLGVGVRQGANMNNAKLAGEFIAYELGHESNTWTSRMVYNFDGNGHGTFTRTADSEGQVTGIPVALAYSVGSTGDLSIDGQPVGVMSANGEYLLFADTDGADANPGISLGIGVKTALVAPVVVPDKIGAYRQGDWYLDASGNGSWEAGGDFSAYFGTGAMTPLAGDWNGNGQTKIGAYVNGNWYFDLNGNGLWDGEPSDRIVTSFGDATDIPVVGDWNGNGVAKIGIYRPSNFTWYLDYDGDFSYNPAVDIGQPFGFGGCVPVVGDWNGNGRDKIGVYYEGQWYLDANGSFGWDGSPADTYVASFGVTGMLPVAGDWSGSGVDRIGAYRDGNWYLDLDGNTSWDPASDSQKGPFGVAGMLPMVGKW